MAIQSLAMGGAEKFFTNLASSLSERHEVTCYIPALGCGDPMIIRRLQSIPVVSIPLFNNFGYKMFYKLTLMLQRHFPQADPEAAWHDRNLRALHRKHRFDIVNSQLMEGTRQVCRAFEHVSLPITESDHGDFSMVDPARLLQNAVIFRRLDALICPSQANVEKANVYPWRPDIRLPMIPYGYMGSPGNSTEATQRGPAFTFGLVARGVVEKGWEEAVAAGRLLRKRGSKPFRLLFVGAGPCLERLERDISAEDRSWIEFAGQQENPEDWIRRFDVGLLPSHLLGESLPNTIIEYLACGKAVIATAIGGVPEMVANAGRLIPLAGNGRADIRALAQEMQLMLDDVALRDSLVASTGEAFSKYSMQRCVAAYEQVFEEMRGRSAFLAS
ncbi:MAG: glycosyltransferase family 4 protein [Verrucomicrobiaceae bacterium]